MMEEVTEKVTWREAGVRETEEKLQVREIAETGSCPQREAAARETKETQMGIVVRGIRMVLLKVGVARVRVGLGGGLMTEQQQDEESVWILKPLPFQVRLGEERERRPCCWVSKEEEIGMTLWKESEAMETE